MHALVQCLHHIIRKYPYMYGLSSIPFQPAYGIWMIHHSTNKNTLSLKQCYFKTNTYKGIFRWYEIDIIPIYEMRIIFSKMHFPWKMTSLNFLFFHILLIVRIYIIPSRFSYGSDETHAPLKNKKNYFFAHILLPHES